VVDDPQVRWPGVSSSVLDTIGGTPLVELGRFSEGLPGRILLKLEMASPGQSKKDRVALQVFRDALASGRLRPGQPVAELTSGNMGAGTDLWSDAGEGEASS